MKIDDQATVERAARVIHYLGAKYVIVKGGHALGEKSVDVLFDGAEFHEFSATRIDTQHTHGTGCTFSSAIASGLAKGDDVFAAVEAAKDYVTEAIRHAYPIGRGHGPLNHFHAYE